MTSKRLLDRVSRSFSKSSKASQDSNLSVESESTLSVLSTGSKASRSSKASNKSFTSIAEEMSLGLAVLAEGQNPIIDIIAIHGLNGHRERTWSAANGINWLRDLLPLDVPNARIMSYGYNVNVFDHGRHGLDQQQVYDHARSLVGDLVLKRQLSETERRPIIFVAHSLGGIMLKAALIHSDSCRTGSLESHHAIATSTHGVIFMGVPHQGGGGVALGKALVNIASVFAKADAKILKDLERDSQLLSTQLGQFQAISGSFLIKFAYETLETRTVLGHTLMVVPMSSAIVPGAVDAESISIAADHRNMTRFTSANDPGYQKISGHIRLMIKSAVGEIDQKWRIDDGKRHVESSELKKDTIIRLKDIVTSSFFTGREEELSILRQYLTSWNGYRHVVIWGAGGCGKTAIAINYALTYSKEFSAIFLVSAKDVQTIRKDYVDIASDLGLAEAVPQGDIDVGKQDMAIKAVKRWFTDHKIGDWLLIIDNADDLACEAEVKKDDDNLDKTETMIGVDVQDYIPSTSKGHIIMTSQDRRSASFSPNSIALGDMKQSDAEALFLGKAKIHNPTPEQIEHTIEIVQKLGCLALAVDHAGSYVHDNDMTTRLRDYMSLLEQSVTKVLDNKNAPMFSLHKTSVLATVTMARDSIVKRNMKAAYMLHLIGVLDGTSVKESFLRARTTVAFMRSWGQSYDENYDDCVKILRSFSLIRVHKGDDGQTQISMHGLVHTCVQGIMKQENQWKWIGKAMQILRTEDTEKLFDYSYFAHLRFIMQMILGRQKAIKDIGKAPRGIYPAATILVHAHHDRWRQLGLMNELYELGCMLTRGLEDEDEKGDAEILTLPIAISIKIDASQYTNDSRSYDLHVRDFLVGHMFPGPAKVVEEIEAGRKGIDAFKFDSLDKVFKNCEINAILPQMYSQFAIEVGKGCIGRNDPEPSELFFNISRLPPTGDLKVRIKRWWVAFVIWLYALWTGIPSSATVETKMLQAGRDRIAGKMDSTLSLLREMALEPSPPGKEAETWVTRSRAMLDLIRLLLKQNKISEADTLLSNFEKEDIKDCADEEAMRVKWADLYIWERKLKVEILKARVHEGGYHATALDILQRSLTTMEIAAGEKALGAVHVHWLLQSFYLQPCCFDSSKVEEHRAKALEGFTLMYCSSKRRFREGEGFRMGKILLMQGSLEEAVFVLTMSRDEGIRELGADDPLTKEMVRICAVAEKELAEQEDEVRRGMISMRWGSYTFWRDVSGL